MLWTLVTLVPVVGPLAYAAFSPRPPSVQDDVNRAVANHDAQNWNDPGSDL